MSLRVLSIVLDYQTKPVAYDQALSPRSRAGEGVGEGGERETGCVQALFPLPPHSLRHVPLCKRESVRRLTKPVNPFAGRSNKDGQSVV